ncbi:MAG: CorA family divalent cation transporter [bacterium]
MLFRYEYQNGVWVDLERPSEDELREIASEFSLSKQIEKEMFSPTPTSLVTDDSCAMLLVLHFPSQNTENNETKNQEIDFIIGNNFILTVHYEVIEPLHRLKKLLETREIISGSNELTIDVMLEILFAHLYASVRDYTDSIASRLSSVEQDMFNGHERKTVRSISSISREFLHLESALANQEEPLRRFFETLMQYDLLDSSFKERAKCILAERSQVARLVAAHRAVAIELRETNTALLGARQNEIMKTLTTITVIVLPLELIAFIFGMHLPGTPLEQNPNSFFIVMMIMFGAVGCMTLFFAKKRWIF